MCNQKPVYSIMRVSTHPYYIGICTVTFCFRPCVRPMTPACSQLFPPSHGWPVCRVAPTAPRQPAPRTPQKSRIFWGWEGCMMPARGCSPVVPPYCLRCFCVRPLLSLCFASCQRVLLRMPSRCIVVKRMKTRLVCR